MKKLYLLTAAFLSACMLVVGCGLAEDTPAIQTIESQTVESSVKESTQEVSEEPSEEAGKESLIIEERFEKDGKMQSYLTGEWKDTSVVNRRSMAVMVFRRQALFMRRRWNIVSAA